MSVIDKVMEIEMTMTGEVNKHKFKITGKGVGKPFEGTQTIDLKVEEGGPLPFAFDILTTATQYGNRAFTKYPPGIPDYFKQSFPEGFSWTRTMAFADGGVCDVKNNITMDGNKKFHYNIEFIGKNFDKNGPIMKKKTLKWEPSTESMYDKDGVLQGDAFRYLLLDHDEGGGHLRCDFRTTYTAKKPVKMPEYHYIFHRIEILSHDKDFNQVKVYEIAEACQAPLAK